MESWQLSGSAARKVSVCNGVGTCRSELATIVSSPAASADGEMLWVSLSMTLLLQEDLPGMPADKLAQARFKDQTNLVNPLLSRPRRKDERPSTF